MKKDPVKISANEINRFMYCPYQWYYKRTYGMKALNQQYKDLKLSHSEHDNFYEKGFKHHQHYHTQYQAQRVLQGIAVVLVIAIIAGVMVQ